jgi:hypothetical protein
VDTFTFVNQHVEGLIYGVPEELRTGRDQLANALVAKALLSMVMILVSWLNFSNSKYDKI